MRIICLHGNSGSISDFDQLKGLFQNKSHFEVISLGLKWHNQESYSEEEVSLPDMGVDLANKINSLLNASDEAYAVLAHSLGGNVFYHSLPHLILLPQKIMTFGAPPLETPREVPEMFLPEETAAFFFDDNPNKELLDGFIALNSRPYQAPKEIANALTKGIKETHKHFRSRFFNSIQNGHFENEWQNIRNANTETHFLVGETDPFINDQYLFNLAKNESKVEFKRISNIGHYPHLQSCSALYEEILSIISRD